MTRRVAAAWLVAAALLGPRAHADAAPATSFDYLYVRAHEASASGGHAAIRFGADAFDFQHQDGWLALRREDSRRFQHFYRTLQNRGIEVSRVEATPETVALLRETFERRLLAQSRQQALVEALAREVELLDALAHGEKPMLPVRGAGFFAAPGTPQSAPPSLLTLRERVAAAHGAGWLAARRDAALRVLRDASLTAPAETLLDAEPLAVPVASDPFARRAAQSLAAIAASELVLDPRGLASGVRAGDGAEPDPWLRLDAARHARLIELRAALLEAAVALAASRRPDWGEALLLASARLAALDESLASGQLVVLDAFPADAKRLRVGPRRRALLPVLQDDARQDLLDAYQRVFNGSGFRERDWRELEMAVTRNQELRAVRDGAERLRIFAGPMLPEGIAELPLPALPAVPRAELERMADARRSALRAQRDALEARYRYHLLERNCVSELFRTIEVALASAPGAPPGSDRDAIRAFVRRESERRLGGYVDPVASANFIPFVSSHHVRASWRVAEEIHLDSAREHAISQEGTLAAALRESNVFTSSFYEPAENDNFFVFFTDGEWPLRPLLGAANLAAALTRSGVGLFQLPFDRGAGLRAGLGGVLWSAPDLLFVNIRKGTNEYVPPAQRPPIE